MKANDIVFIFGIVFVGLPLLGLAIAITETVWRAL